MISWRRAWQPTPVFLPGESHGQRSLAGYSPWCCKIIGHDWATKQLTQVLGRCSPKVSSKGLTTSSHSHHLPWLGGRPLAWQPWLFQGMWWGATLLCCHCPCLIPRDLGTTVNSSILPPPRWHAGTYADEASEPSWTTSLKTKGSSCFFQTLHCPRKQTVLKNFDSDEVN